jgi:hypothetical protein
LETYLKATEEFARAALAGHLKKMLLEKKEACLSPSRIDIPLLGFPCERPMP